MKKILWGFVCIANLLGGCTKNEEIKIDDTKSGLVKLKFDHIVGSKKLVLNNYVYSNASNETFNITSLKYYISNIKFTKANGEIFTIPKKESFFLIDAGDVSTLQPVVTIPQGVYTALTFNLGVDSLTNTLPAEERIGVLDVAKYGMYWAWNSGYIHFKLEGNSPQATNPNNSFKYHIGLFGGYNTPTVNNNRIIKIDLIQAGQSQVQENLSSDIHLMVDIGKIFDGPNIISIKNNPVVMTSGPHVSIADNYAAMFTHDHTHNFTKVASNEK